MFDELAVFNRPLNDAEASALYRLKRRRGSDQEVTRRREETGRYDHSKPSTLHLWLLV